MRQIVLDTETTGLEAALGHRVIEMRRGGDRQPPVDRGATSTSISTRSATSRWARCRCTGSTLEFLQDKPRFADVVSELLDFIGDAGAHHPQCPVRRGLSGQRARSSRAAAHRDLPPRWSPTLCAWRAICTRKAHAWTRLCERYQIDNSAHHGACRWRNCWLKSTSR